MSNAAADVPRADAADTRRLRLLRRIESRYRVASIGPDMVDLTDLASNSTLRLALK